MAKHVASLKINFIDTVNAPAPFQTVRQIVMKIATVRDMLPSPFLFFLDLAILPLLQTARRIVN